MKTVIKVVLLVAIIGLAYWVYRIPAATVEFQTALASRQKEVVQRLKDIRDAERAYKRNYNKYTGSFDTLIMFLKNDSLVYEKSMGSLDDSLAVAQGRVKTEKIKMAIRDTIFSGRNVNFDDLRYVPFTENVEFELGAKEVKTESSVIVPIFEAKTPYTVFMQSVGNDQEIINLVDRYTSMDKYPGLKVGSLTSPNNDAGNWED
ncbi:MAG: hypothetical protein RSB93_00495 [Rikenellaceae bacterium]